MGSQLETAVVAHEYGRGSRKGNQTQGIMQMLVSPSPCADNRNCRTSCREGDGRGFDNLAVLLSLCPSIPAASLVAVSPLSRVSPLSPSHVCQNRPPVFTAARGECECAK